MTADVVPHVFYQIFKFNDAICITSHQSKVSRVTFYNYLNQEYNFNPPDPPESTRVHFARLFKGAII